MVMNMAMKLINDHRNKMMKYEWHNVNFSLIHFYSEDSCWVVTS